MGASQEPTKSSEPIPKPIIEPPSRTSSQAPVQSSSQAPTPASQAPSQPTPTDKGLEQELKDTVDLVRREVPTSLSGMEKLPIHLLLIILGAGCSVLFGIVFFFVQLGEGHVGAAILNLLVCLIFGALLLFAFVVIKRRTMFGAALAGVFGLILIVAGGTGGLIGGLVALGGVGIILLKEFGILSK